MLKYVLYLVAQYSGNAGFRYIPESKKFVYFILSTKIENLKKLQYYISYLTTEL